MQHPTQKEMDIYSMNVERERMAQCGIEPEDATPAYAGGSLLDDPDFVPEIATPQEVRQ